MRNTPLIALLTAVLLAIGPLESRAHAQKPSELEPGATLRIYEIGRPIDRLAPLGPEQTPNHDRLIEAIDFPGEASLWAGEAGPNDYLVVTVTGYLKIDTRGEYAFELTSDDGSRLFVDGQRVIDNDGLHAPVTVRGSIELEIGLHPFRVEHFESAGGAALRLSWRPPGESGYSVVPKSALRVEKGVTRVTSPGRKVLLDGNEHLRPGDGLPLDGVHPMWTVETVRPEGVEHRIGAMDFMPDGALVYSEFVPVNNGILRTRTNGTLWKLEGVDGGRGRAEAMPVRVADGFHDPSGIVCIGTSIWVSHRPGLVRLRDSDGDGEYETRSEFPVWVGSNYHHFSFGLQHHTDESGSWIYGTLSTSIYFQTTYEADPVDSEVIGMNGPNPPHRGSCYRFNTETHEVQWLGGGLRTPNGVHVDSKGRVLVADNQGAWHPANRLNHIKYEIDDEGNIDGRFFGHYNGLQKSTLFPEGGVRADFMTGGEYPPAVWLPQNEVSNSPTTPLEILDGPFEGQYWLGELTAGGIRRVFLEEVNGELQGAVFRHTQGLESGVNRLIRGEDGCLYMGGTGADGNWNWRGTQFGLQRLRPTGETAFEYHSIRATPDGFELRFTEPVLGVQLRALHLYEVRQWDYFPTPAYGGPKLNEQRLAVTDAVHSQDRTAVRLVIPGLREGSVVHIRSNLRSDARDAMWSSEAWYTLNQIPGREHSHTPAYLQLLNQPFLSAFEGPYGDWTRQGEAEARGTKIKSGTDYTFGATLNNEPGSGAEEIGKGTIEHQQILVNGDGRTRDLFTQFEHGDIAAHIEFMIPEGSNSGVYFQSRYEIQIFDSHVKTNPQHNDMGGIYQRWDSSCGAGSEGFGGVPPRVNAARPAGEWNELDVVFRAPRFDPQGAKIANARFELVRLNGEVIHENVEVTGPTRGGAEGEVPFAPLRLQGDHGPVAYRYITLRPLESTNTEPTNSDADESTPDESPWPAAFAEELGGSGVLVFSKTAGFRHGSIPDGIEFFREFAWQYGAVLHATEDAADFNSANLENYDAVVFLNTTGDVLNDEQQAAFEAWYRDGGAFVGIHSAADTEDGWDWYGRLVGARFTSHPQIQPARMIIARPLEDGRDHPAVSHLGGYPHFDTWTRTDEWYDFRAQPVDSTTTLLRLDGATYAGGRVGDDASMRRTHPICWSHEFDGGRAIYTGGGHTKASYAEPDFRRHLLGCLAWALGAESGAMDAAPAETGASGSD